MKTKHTPGPWTILPGNENWLDGVVISDSDSDSIATVHWGMHDAVANARLIAAAPDLFEACVAIANLADGQGRMNLLEVSGMVRKVIAKVKGE